MDSTLAPTPDGLYHYSRVVRKGYSDIKGDWYEVVDEYYRKEDQPSGGLSAAKRTLSITNEGGLAFVENTIAEDPEDPEPSA